MPTHMSIRHVLITQVGIHIADVSHWVRPCSALDRHARWRGTTTYLVDRNFPMLPRQLSENLCSLHGAVARYTFSVVVRLADDGTVRSVAAVMCTTPDLKARHVGHQPFGLTAVSRHRVYIPLLDSSTTVAHGQHTSVPHVRL